MEIQDCPHKPEILDKFRCHDNNKLQLCYEKIQSQLVEFFCNLTPIGKIAVKKH